MTFGEERETNFFITIGPYIDFLWSANLNGSQTFIVKDSNRVEAYGYNDKIQNYLSKTNFGITIGGGIIIPFVNFPGKLFIEGRYDLNLTSTKFNGSNFLNDNILSQSLGLTYNPVFKNYSIILNAGLVFNL